MSRTLPTLLRSPVFQGLLWAVYVCVASAGLMEALLRMGVLDTPPYLERQSILERLTDRPRVLVLGDSFSIEGDGSVGSLLKEYFDHRRMDMINLAKMGEGPSFYLDRFRQYGLLVRPRLVLVNYFVGNDLTDTAYERASRGRAKVLAKRLMARSFAANQLLGMLHGLSLRRRLADIEASDDYGQPGLERVANPFLFEVRREHPDFLVQNLMMESDEARRAWVANTRSLLEIKRLAQALDAELVIHVFPPDVQVQESHFPFYQALGIHTDRRFLVSDRPQARFTEFCAVNGLRCYDLLPALRTASDRELYLEQDTHWNVEGNRVAFREITNNLESSATAVRASPRGVDY